MNKRPGRVEVTTEAGYCNFCGRPRNLRHEQHQLGNFVRTVVTCETCHRTLSSTMGVASPDTAEVEAPVQQEESASAAEATPAKRTAAKKTEPATTRSKTTTAKTTKTTRAAKSK
jgi:hypothetical protein